MNPIQSIVNHTELGVYDISTIIDENPQLVYQAMNDQGRRRHEICSAVEGATDDIRGIICSTYRYLVDTNGQKPDFSGRFSASRSAIVKTALMMVWCQNSAIEGTQDRVTLLLSR